MLLDLTAPAEAVRSAKAGGCGQQKQGLLRGAVVGGNAIEHRYPDRLASARTTDIMRAVKFLLDQAEERGMPCVVNISYGTNWGDPWAVISQRAVTRLIPSSPINSGWLRSSPESTKPAKHQLRNELGVPPGADPV